MKRDHLYRAGKFLSLAAVLCFPVKFVLAQDEFGTHRKKTMEEFQDFKDGRRSAKAQEELDEATPAEAPVVAPAAPPVAPVAAPVPVAPVAVPVAAPAAVPVAAKAKSAGTTFRDCPDCPEMVVIPAGSFEMGEQNNAHVMSVPAFAMGKTEVTQAQWKALMRRNPSHHKQCGDDCPVESVSWEEVQSYVDLLNEKTGKQYRLASAAEWEYACRAGGKHRYCGTADAFGSAWHKGNSNQAPHGVATLQPNAFGLYDMNGNVGEWTADGSNKYYMVRGGSYGDELDQLYPHLREETYINRKESNIGFRLVRTLP
jgi:formylglycine-generating enzyme required for sulfatase activity